MRSEVSVRPANKDDEPFIFSSWLRCYRSSAFASNIPSDVYFTWHGIIKHEELNSSRMGARATDILFF